MIKKLGRILFRKKKNQVRLFVSYSHQDERLVNPIVKLLRVAESKVFFDVDSIPAGGRWKDGIEDAIIKADKLCVFWCEHASKSQWVEREWTFALKVKKPIVPILLDKTPLEYPLSEYQYLDITNISEGTRFQHGGQSIIGAPPTLVHGLTDLLKNLFRKKDNNYASRITQKLIPLIQDI